MKALITGIAGFIGFHTAARLSKAGWTVAGVDNLNDYYDPGLKRARLAALGDAVSFHELDIAAAVAFAKLIDDEQPDVIIHLAAQAGVRYSIENPFAYARSNLLGHLSVLEACRHAKNFSHLIYASSSSVYGGNKKTPFSETDPVDAPVSLYAATKKSDELMSATYAHLYGVQQIGLRFFTVYGPWGRPDMAYWTFTDKMLRGDPIPVFNHGRMRRDFTYIDDVVDCIAAIADKPPSFAGEDRPHRIYNIGNHTPVPLLDMIGALENATGRKAQMDMKDMQPGDVCETYADVDRLAADYGFNPATPIDKGLKQFVDWYRAYFNV
ncbi:NAD-dependent epimerase/dehydratase family protein [Hyphococcus sp.]|uniref:NAD-dependent epimerase/dehydratase family protein n=1 Tax=Hyphococcus sp. TaxID=2038636 RepID=UPI003CCBF006